MPFFHNYERSNGGYVTGVGGRPVRLPDTEQKRAPSHAGFGYVIGVAARFGKCHRNDATRGLEIFMPHVFDRSLADGSMVRFLLDHSALELFATSADPATLQVKADDECLGFALKLAGVQDPIGLMKGLASRPEMSTAYRVIEDEKRTVDGDDVRLLRDVALVEISAVRRAACPMTFRTYIDDAHFDLAAEMRSGRLRSEWAATKLRRALCALQAA